jgi:DNA-binding NarL/FixJ family response regulator
MKKANLLLVDDQPFFRKGIIASIPNLSDQFKILEAKNGKIAIEMCDRINIDLVILDIALKDLDGYAVLDHMKRNKLQIKTIVLTIYSEASLIFHLLNEGVQGFLLKNSPPYMLSDAITQVLNGGIYYPKEFSERIQFLIQSGTMPSIKLSLKEVEIIELLAGGLTSKEIAIKTNYTEQTINTKKLRLYKKLKARSSAEIVNFAYKVGILKI